MAINTSKHASTSLPNTMDFSILENMLQDTSVTQICLPIEFIKYITCNFSKERELGRGGCGVVYKGILQNGKIFAVKKLSEIHLEEDQFEREVTYLIGVKHQNIVRLVGYCAESRWEATDVNGKYVMAETRNRILCFEYLQNNSLDKHISAESSGLEWQMRYDIIRGVCCGLHYLHTECRIVHLDLKPQNILLDVNMLPKLADFGISRLFDTQQSRIITERRAGTFGYMAPEYINNGLITTKSDMFSLGVIIIELITGHKEYPQSSEMPYEHFIENVIGNWRDRLKKTMGYIASEICSQQIHRCIVLALKCIDPDPKERPSACDIVQMLNEPESTNGVFDKNEEPTAGQPFKDGLIKDDSDATSNVGSPSMAIPHFQETQYKRQLYMHQTIDGPNHDQVNIADPKQPLMFGYTNVHDYPIYDSLSSSAKIVARAQGLHTETSINYDDWFHWSSIVFTDERFKGSRFMAIGNQNVCEGEWAIVGGTGVFTFAQGTISIHRIEHKGSSNIKQIRIRAFCRTVQTTPTETQPFKDGLIKVDSDATSNVGSPSMAIPHFQETQYYCQLYMHQTIDGPDHNQVNIADPKQPLMFGYTNVHDYPIYDSLSSSAKIVARAQGLHTETSMNYNDWFHWSSIVFTDERFKGSRLMAIGNQNVCEGEWAIVGGTGVFTFAQGTISIHRLDHKGSSNIKQIRIRAFCRTVQTTPTETQPFKDGLIKVDSDATSNVGSPSMAIPHFQQTQYNRQLYMHQTIDGPNHNQVNIADPKQPLMFGYTNVHDYPIYDSLSSSAKIVARAQGLHTETSMNYDDWFHWSSIVFTDERFKGSRFMAIGNQNRYEGEWAIVGGTGVFTFAQGTISIHRIEHKGSSNIKQIRIRAFCRTVQTTPTETKVNTSF